LPKVRGLVKGKEKKGMAAAEPAKPNIKDGIRGKWAVPGSRPVLRALNETGGDR